MVNGKKRKRWGHEKDETQGGEVNKWGLRLVRHVNKGEMTQEEKSHKNVM